MESREPDVRDSKAAERPLQFTLRTMFIVLTLSAISLAGLTTGPDRRAVATALVLAVCTPVVLATGVVRSRGYVRAFCIGALLPALGMALAALALGEYAWSTSSASGPSDMMRFYSVMFLIFWFTPIVLLGLLAVGVRCLVEALRRRQLRRGERRAPGESQKT